MKKTMERFPIFLLLLPAFVVIHFEKEFHRFVRYEFIYDRIIILFILPLLFFLLFYFSYRSARKASLMAVALLMIFCFTGDIKNKLAGSFPGQVGSRYVFLLPVLLMLLAAIFFFIKKSKSHFSSAFLFINLALLLFIAADVAGIIFKPRLPKYSPVREKEIAVTGCDTCHRPDIYYIVVDAYTSSAVLKEDFNHANTLMEEDLRSKGFIIMPQSRSNYNYTAFSTGSTLNLDYLDGVDTLHKTTDRTYLQALGLVYKNHLVEFLQKENYLIRNHSIFDFKNAPTTVTGIDFWNIRGLFDQYNLAFKLVRDAGHQLPEKLRAIFREADFDINKPPARKRMASEVTAHLMKSVKMKADQPKFVYAHFIEPHPPFYLDSLGNIFKSAVSLQQGYVHSIAFINKLIKQATDSILFYTSRPCVIIIQGDHGAAYENEPESDRYFSNLHAVYFSNREYGFFTDSTHNVNSFRIALNVFFKKNYPLLEYKSFYLK